MGAERRAVERRSWLHNMSVPSRSVLHCERACLPGRRYLVDPVPCGIEPTALGEWRAAAHECLALHGMAALAVLGEIFRAGSKVRPGKLRSLARSYPGDPVEAVKLTFRRLLPPRGAPDGIGVFLPAPPGEATRPGGGQTKALTPLASLAVLAQRSGPLFVPARPVEPSLIVLERCLLVFPEPAEPAEGERR